MGPIQNHEVCRLAARLTLLHHPTPCSRRISVQSGFGGNDLTEIIYPDIVGLKYVYRSGGSVGDMVIELKDGAKLEMRHVPQFRDIYKYILEKVTDQARENSDAMRE